MRNPDEIKNKKDKFNFEVKALVSIVGLLMFAIFCVLITKFNFINPSLPIIPVIPGEPGQPAAANITAVKNFSSEEDFKKYLEESAKISASYYGGGFGRSLQITNEMMPAPGAITSKTTDSGAPDRVSGTNVQVIGIDEPDIVKTDGKEIYFSGIPRYYYGPMMKGVAPGDSGITFEEQQRIDANEKIMMPPLQPQEKTSIIKAFPPANLAVDSSIDKQGDLLLDKNILVIFPTQRYYYGYGNKQTITAYDVSDPKSPKEKWSIKLDDNTSIVTSRIQNGKIYLITRNNIDQSRPCPLKPLSIGDSPISISCQEIYHPVMPIPVDTTFVVSLIDPATGKIGKNVSFVGSSSSNFSGTTVIYVSNNAIYTTYTYLESQIKFISGFITENSDFFPATLVAKINKLNTYDISESSKMTEFATLMNKYENSLNADDRLKLSNEMQNRMDDYYKVHSRDLEKTGIVKIDTASFAITAQGEIPGHLLNNFSMDEYNGNLRIASTTGNTGGMLGNMSVSFSDVYVLDKDLNTIGSVKDLGRTEQIYSVRFIEDKGYVVTFRRTDPFYVLDLANPRNPALAGELKIPGYSSYLHPLDATHVLGIGMEGSQVKISLFDVTDKSNPTELDKYLLDEYWSEVSNNYHAFLLDTKHNIFFLPGSKGGYVFSYIDPIQSNPKLMYKLKLKKAVSQNSVKRAIYLADYLYIIGDDKITVLNELDWEKVNELDLQQ